jgi:hypothetical protein
MCVCILDLCCGQSPPRKSEDELREEEELQLALALSKSEAEHKEKEVIMTIFILFLLLFPVNISHSVLFNELLHFLSIFHYLQITEKQCMTHRCATMESIFGKLLRTFNIKLTISQHL